MAKKVAEHLKRALALFGENGENWSKGPFDKLPESKKCVVLAISDSADDAQVCMESLRVIKRTIGTTRATRWNDAPERTWPEVKAAFEKAVTMAAELNQPASPIQSVQGSPEVLEQDVAK